MIFASFYTVNSPYEISIKKLRKNLISYGFECFIQAIPAEKSWKETCGSRGDFIADIMDRYNDDVVWIDADAEILQNPKELFEVPKEADIAAFHRKDQILLGTSLFRNRPHVKAFLRKWSKKVPSSSKTISQMVFKDLLLSHPEIKIMDLPQKLCQIFDLPIEEEPVIIHKQFSRMKKADGNIKTLQDRKRVFLPVNLNGWAFDVRCNALHSFLSHAFDLSIIPMKEMAYNANKADLTYFCTYESIRHHGSKCKSVCASVAGLVVNNLRSSTEYFKNAKAIAVPNVEWFEQYNEMALRQKFFYIPNSVDLSLFKKKETNERPFTVGWVGNDLPAREHIKRVNTLRSVCKRLGIPLLEQNYLHKQIPHEDMPDFYNNIDLYVNVSTTEGSNNCLLEAAACEVPIAGTPVGNMPELAKKGAFLIKDDLSNLEETILSVMTMTEEERENIGRGMRLAMWNHYSWYYGAKRFKQMFDYCLEAK